MSINQHAIDNMKIGDNAVVTGTTGQISRIRHVKMAGRVFTITCPHTGEKKKGLVHQYMWDEKQKVWKNTKRKEK